MSNDKPDISVVIPFHNEAESLEELIPAIISVTRSLSKLFEIILVDDVSTDGSLDVARRFCERYEEVRLIQLTTRGGQTGCFRRAFEEAMGEHVIRMDADLQDDPQDLAKFVEKIDQGAEVVMGLRECRKHSRMLRFASGIYDLMVLLLFDSPFHANSGSYVAFKTEFVRNIPFRTNDHRYLPLIAIRRGAKNLSEVIVRHHDRAYGRSKYRPLKKLLLGIPEVLRFLFRLQSGVYDVAKKHSTVGD